MTTEESSEGGGSSAVQPVVISQFTVPRNARMKDVVRFSWSVSNAESVMLVVSGSVRAQMPVDPCGSWTVIADDLGPMYVELFAVGEPDDFGNRSSAHELREFLVRAPPVRLLAHPRALRGKPETYVRLSWYADNAARVVIRRRLHGFQMDAPPRDAVDILVDAIEDEVEITAISHDGDARQTFVCRILPDIEEVPDLDHDLEWFDEPTLEQRQWQQKKKAG